MLCGRRQKSRWIGISSPSNTEIISHCISNSDKAIALAVKGPHKVEKTPRRVRGFFDQECLFDTTDAHFVWEHPYYPFYYIPENVIKSGMLTRNAPNGDGLSSGVLKGEHKSTDQVLIFEKGPLSGLVRFEAAALGRLSKFLAQVVVQDERKLTLSRCMV